MTHELHEHPGAHPHRHGPACGHTTIRHDGHLDYLHEGHLHHPKGDRVEEHRIEVSETNPDRCTPDHKCAEHTGGYRHGGGEGRGHEAHEVVPHGDHVDYLHEGRLHHQHGDHCDDHGPVEIERGR